MNIAKVAELIDLAITNDPPDEILQYCDRWYSPYYHLIYLLMQDTNGGVFVELGVESGRGCFSALCSKETRYVIGVDTVRHTRIGELRARFGGRFDFRHTASLPTISHVPLIDVLHIDTEHSYAQVKAEFEAYRPLLWPCGGVVLFDDLHAAEDDVLRYFRELPYPKIHDDRLHPICGFGVMVYESHS